MRKCVPSTHKKAELRRHAAAAAADCCVQLIYMTDGASGGVRNVLQSILRDERDAVLVRRLVEEGRGGGSSPCDKDRRRHVGQEQRGMQQRSACCTDLSLHPHVECGLVAKPATLTHLLGEVLTVHAAG